MKTVVISGYYGFENLGDEALLYSMIKSLRALVPDLNIIVLSAKPDKTKSLYGVEAVYRWDPLAVSSALRKADLLLSGGGSLLQDVTGHMTIPYYLGIVFLAKMLGKRVMFYAQGIGPVNGIVGRTLIRLIANRADFITLRDSASARLLKEIGVSRPPVEVTADPVFGVSDRKSLDKNRCDPAVHAAPGASGVDPAYKGKVGIFVREWKDIGGYKKAVSGLADFLCEHGWQVAFVPMQYPEDVTAMREIAGMMQKDPIIIEKEFSFPQLIEVISAFDLVIGMRLHALIIAALCNVPMVGISYDPKVSEFLESIKQPVVTNLVKLSSEELVEKVNQVINNSEAIKIGLKSMREELREKAIRNSEIAVELLK